MIKNKPYDLELENAYPNVNVPLIPLSDKILVQYRTERARVSKGGIILSDNSKQDHHHNQVVKVVALGPLVFHTRNFDNGEPLAFKESAWFAAGDYVRVPLNGVDQVFVMPTEAEKARIKYLTDENKKNPDAVYFAAENLTKGCVKFGLLPFGSVIAKVTDPLIVLNGH